MNKIFTQLLEQADDKDAMLKAINAKKFWVEAIPCICGYSIGTFGGELPALYATKAEVEAEHQDMIETYQQQIADGERNPDDEWEGEVLEAHWDGESELMVLAIDGDPINTESWRLMAGL